MNSRFDTQVVGYGSFEFDHADGTLRLAWLGEQMFLSKIEATGLREFLNKVIPPVRPTIVTLCGSTRFSQEFHDENLRETLLGHIVLSIGCDLKSDHDLMVAGKLTEEAIDRLHELHLRKIDMADEVFVLNVGGYIGEHTRREIEYARSLGKRIRWLEEPVEGSVDPVEIPHTFAQGACPNCGLDFTAHSAWIANPGDTTCEEVEEL